MGIKPRQWQPMFNSQLGLKQGYAITNMPPGSCLDIKNMYLNGLGGKVSRNGYVELFHNTYNYLSNGTITGSAAVESTLLQAVSGATATVKEIQTGKLLVVGVTGTFDTTNVVTGTNPDATTYTFTPSATLVSNVRVTDIVKSLIQYNPYGATSEVLDFSGTRIYKRNGTNADIVKSGLSSGVPWEWIQYRNFILGVNGAATNNSFLYNGTTVTTICIERPTSEVTLADGGAVATGLDDGDYWYVTTFYDSTTGRESDPYNGAFGVLNAPSVTVSSGAGVNSIELSAFATPVVGSGVDSYRIYRKRNSETVFTRIAEVQIGVDTAVWVAGVYTDIDNTDFNIELDYDTGQADTGFTPAPTTVGGNNSGLICEQFDRIFMVDPNDPSILIFSKVGDYWAFPVANFVYVGRGDGSAIKRIEKHGKSLLIHKGNGWYILDSDPVGNSSIGLTPGVVKFLSKIGTQDIRTSVSAHNQVVRLTPVGFYRSMPTDYDTGDLREDYIGLDIATLEGNLDYNNSNIATMYSYNASNRRHIYYIEPISASFYSKCLVFDIVLSQWIYFEIGTDVYSAADYIYQGEKYMMFGDGYGIVWQWDVGNSDGHALLNIECNGTVTSAGNTTLTDTTKTWTVNGLIGCSVDILSGTGILQKRRILSNTADTITVTAWATNPDSSSVYTIGAIDKYAEECWDSCGDPHILKRMRWVIPYIAQTGNYDITLSFRKDFDQTYLHTETISLSSSSSLWGAFLWDTGTWGGPTSNLRRINLHGKYHYYSIKYQNKKAGEAFSWDGHGAVFQLLPDRMR